MTIQEKKTARDRHGGPWAVACGACVVYLSPNNMKEPEIWIQLRLSSGHRTAAIDCFVASHSLLARLIYESLRYVRRFRTSPTSQSQRTSRAPNAPKNGPIFASSRYNSPTTVQPIICQFPKNIHLISSLVAVVYGKCQNLAPVSMNVVCISRIDCSVLPAIQQSL